MSSMLQQGKREAQLLVDDGTGAVDIWRIEDFEMVPLDKGLYGQFFGGDSYVMLYTYLTNGKENYLIYFWLGQVSVIGVSMLGICISISGGWQGQVSVSMLGI